MPCWNRPPPGTARCATWLRACYYCPLLVWGRGTPFPPCAFTRGRSRNAGHPPSRQAEPAQLICCITDLNIEGQGSCVPCPFPMAFPTLHGKIFCPRDRCAVRPEAGRLSGRGTIDASCRIPYIAENGFPSSGAAPRRTSRPLQRTQSGDPRRRGAHGPSRRVRVMDLLEASAFKSALRQRETGSLL